MTLAAELPEAHLDAVEKAPHLAAEAAARSSHLPNVTVHTGDMTSLTGRYDLIWCAGALYFLGVSKGLRGWLRSLSPAGWIAFSEPVLLEGAQPDSVTSFWAGYPAITDLAGIVQRVRRANFRVEDHRLITGAPWQVYYNSLQRRIDGLKGKAGMDKTLAAASQEIALWQAAPDRIAYALMLVRPA